MKCFYHHESSAVGICKNCYRGICEKCVAEVGDSIACLNRCEPKTKAVMALVERNLEISGKYPGGYRLTGVAYYRTTLFYFLMGVLFLFFGIYDRNSPASIFMKSFGILVLVYSVFNAYTLFKYKKVTKPLADAVEKKSENDAPDMNSR